MLNKLIGLSVFSFGVIELTRETNLIRQQKLYWDIADKLILPIIRSNYVDPELAHSISIILFKNKFGPIYNKIDKEKNNDLIKQNIFNLNFNSPIGLAAGYDKQAEIINPMFELGFGFVEIGGVTPLPQLGNEKPRMFRLTEDEGVINRFGLNSDGHKIIKQRLIDYNNNLIKKYPTKFKKFPDGLVAVNLAKNTKTDKSKTIDDYILGIKNLGENVNFIVLNISCPNVKWTKGLSKDMDEMKLLIQKVKEERNKLKYHKPLLLKLAPDMDINTKKEMAKLILDEKVDGIIVSNTTSTRPDFLKSEHKNEMGGLSGKPLKQLSLQTLKDMYKLTNGEIPIISVGGIENVDDVYERIKNGASLVQIYTTMVYNGLSTVPNMNEQLKELLIKNNHKSIKDIIGIDNKP